ESRMIGRVVEAARQICSEVVVVDSGSTDDTVAIAEAAGARVVRQAWLGLGRQKRFAEELCSNDWLLDLDADEVVSPEFAAEVRALFANGEPPCAAYETMLVTVPPVGKPWWDFAVTDRRKLYDRRKLRQPDHIVWDQFVVPDEMKVGRIKAPLMHYSFPDLQHLAAKLNGYSGVGARENKLKPFPIVALRVMFAQPLYFLRFLIGRGLWRAGLYGWAVSGVVAHGRWLRDAKMLEIHLKRREAAKG
ncbi:MAG TPA: glycosyltransferase family 2 protein, partial [Caulobacterales bacterium]|nr:glycosyltransferase family 2 protein [Caulobacterales bacterium]